MQSWVNKHFAHKFQPEMTDAPDAAVSGSEAVARLRREQYSAQ